MNEIAALGILVAILVRMRKFLNSSNEALGFYGKMSVDSIYRFRELIGLFIVYAVLLWRPIRLLPVSLRIIEQSMDLSTIWLAQLGLIAGLILIVLKNTVFSFGKLVQSDGRLPSWLKVLAGLNIFMLPLLFYVAWPILSFGQEQAVNTVEQFMYAYSNQEYENAEAMLIRPLPEFNDRRTVDNFYAIRNQPVSWSFQLFGAFFEGEASFADGSQRTTRIFLEWEWHKARWGIYGVEFGDEVTEDLRFWLHATVIHYDWFRYAVKLLTIAIVFITIKLFHDAVIYS